MLTKEDLTHDAENSVYWMETPDLGLELDENKMDDAALEFAGKVVEAYPAKVADIAAFLAKDAGMRAAFPGETAETIAEKLGRPVIRLDDARLGRLTYMEQTLDDTHLIDVEFGGPLEEFWNATLDG